MAENCLYVQNLSPTITLPILQKVFGFYGICNVQFAGDQALVQYQNPESCQQAIEYLDNTNLLTANGQQNISIQLIDLAALAQQTIAMSNNIPSNQNQQPHPQNHNNGIKKSQNKDFQNERNHTMNIENKERSASPFQNNNVRIQNMSQNKNLTPNLKNQQQQGMMGNNQSNFNNNIGGRSIGKMNNENLRPTHNIMNQKLPVYGGQNYDNKYFQSTTTNPNPKVSTLVNFYKTNKTNVPNDKMKIYSNYDEFWQDAKKVARTRESTSPYPEMRQTQKQVNYEKMTIAELTIELKKKGHVLSGTKQTLLYALERFNEKF